LVYFVSDLALILVADLALRLFADLVLRVVADLALRLVADLAQGKHPQLITQMVLSLRLEAYCPGDVIASIGEVSEH
jgi:hypothetical protein